jgi:hypothetical protein
MPINRMSGVIAAAPQGDGDDRDHGGDGRRDCQRVDAWDFVAGLAG